MRLFKRVRRGTAFAACAVNRRGQTAAGPAAAKQALAGNLDDLAEEAVCLACRLQPAMPHVGPTPEFLTGYSVESDCKSVSSHAAYLI